MKWKFLSLLLLALPTALSAQLQRSLQPAGTAPFVLGVVDTLLSKVLHEQRVLNIYLPDGYNPSDTVTYPVVYLLDGGGDEDFIHVVGLYQFNTFSWINRVPKSIIVGIANVDRKRDFTFPSPIASQQQLLPTGGHSERFIRFLEEELQPFIRRRYKAAGGRTLIGESLGGLLATEVLLKKPSLFDHYIIISPSLWWGDGALLTLNAPMLRQPMTAPAGVYIGVGKEGVTPGDRPHVMEVDANLLADKIRQAAGKKTRVHFDYLPAENHATVGHQALFNALRLLYPAAAAE